MKAIVKISIIVAAISLIVGIVSRLTLTPVGPMMIQAQAFLQFTNTCLLVAITFAVLQLLKAKG